MLILIVAAVAVGVSLLVFPKKYSLEHIITDLTLKDCQSEGGGLSQDGVIIRKAADCIYTNDRIDGEYFQSTINIELVEGSDGLAYAQERGCSPGSSLGGGSFRYENNDRTLHIDLNIKKKSGFEQTRRSLADSLPLYAPALEDYDDEAQYEQAIKEYVDNKQRWKESQELIDSMYTSKNLQLIGEDISEVLPPKHNLTPTEGCTGDTYLEQEQIEAKQEAERESRAELAKKNLSKHLQKATTSSNPELDIDALKITESGWEVFAVLGGVSGVQDVANIRFIATNTSPSKKTVVCYAAIANVAQNEIYSDFYDEFLLRADLDIGERKNLYAVWPHSNDEYKKMLNDSDAERIYYCQAYSQD